MFPNVYGFSWTPGYLTFLGVFFTVLAVILTTLIMAFYRMRRQIDGLKVDVIRWKSEFHDLSAGERACRHQFTGEFKDRVCERGFECGECATHGRLVHAHPVAAAEDCDVGGLEIPADRMYHRGHTWVRHEVDGTVTVGLDALGKRLFGKPDKLDLPQPGARLHANGAAWTMWRGGLAVRILAPVDGEIVETGGTGQDYYLRLKPIGEKIETAHLLRGAEVKPWLSRELERLQILLAPTAIGASLADGGVPVEDMPKAMPEANWEAVWGEMFIEP